MSELSTYPVAGYGLSRTYADDEAPPSSFAIFLVAAVSVVLVAALWAIGRDQLLRIAIPALAVVVGVALYFQRPVVYVQYTLWIWFLAPLVRRVVDLRFGYTDPNFVLLAPLLVSGISVLTVVLPRRRNGTRIPTPFVLCGIAILYAFVLDMARHPSAESIYGAVDWSAPLLFGLHLYLNWNEYERYRNAVAKTFLIAVATLGLYGVYQFVSPPAWDSYWLENVSLDSINPSFGQPAPFLVRVWSTMHAPGPFADVMMAGLLLLLVSRSRIKIPASVCGYLSFLLSIVRTAWLSWLVGFLLIVRNANRKATIRILLSIVLLVACVLPFLNDPQVSTLVSERMSTFGNLGQDASFRARLDMYQILVADAAKNPFGYGFQNRGVVDGFVVDSGFLVMLFTLGWLGSVLFAAGLFVLLTILNVSPGGEDHFSIASRAIVVALLSQLIGGNVFVTVPGMLFWMFVGLSMSAGRANSLPPSTLTLV